MSLVKVIALLLIAGGVLGLVYGGFTYTRTTHDARIGPLELSIQDKKTVPVPVWVGIGAVVVGGALLLARPKG